ncbi:MAG: tRNA dihydrouridine synthase DusB [Christensenellales bacterium]|jgi:tRNA-dihydrouridine synthase B
MKIGTVETGRLFLAPMAGYTDIGFRYLCRKYGATLTYTEMVSIKGLLYNNENTDTLLAVHESEKPVAVQLFGSDVSAYLTVTGRKTLDKFDIIDINMGCPVRKVVTSGDGSKMMTNIPLSMEVVKACLKSDKPVTVKIRSGYDSVNAPEFARAMEDAGASAITVHARTREQFYSGAADWNVIKAVKAAVNIPVIGNGDISCYQDIEKMLDHTGCDAVMIGRAALGNPYIFSDCEPISLKADIHKHIGLLKNLYSTRTVVNLMKKHICYYGKHISNSKSLRKEINSALTLEEMCSIIESYFL